MSTAFPSPPAPSCPLDTDAYHAARRAEAAALTAEHPSLSFAPLSRRTLALHTLLRARDTDTAQFVNAAEPLLRGLVEAALDRLDVVSVNVQTPTGATFPGCRFAREVVGVSIMRAGESMETALRSCVPGCRIGKLLIQRDESTAEKPAVFMYSKMPTGIAETDVLLLDPMLASGGSAICAVQQLLQSGIALRSITFVCLIACAVGVQALLRAHPGLRVVVGALDESLDERKYIQPGVGDFGDRFFGTVPVEAHPAQAQAAAGGKAQ